MSRLFHWLGSAALCVSALGLTACSESAVPVAGQGGDGDDGSTSRAFLVTSLPDFLSFTPGSRQRLPFRGVRIVTQLEVDNDGIAERLEIREEVGSDGTGGYSIELLGVIDLPSTMDATLYPITHERSVDSFWTKRDFQIHDLDLAAANYTIVHAAQTTVVAGIVCERVEFVRNASHGDRPAHYVVDFDPTTGFVLGWTELDAVGTTLASGIYQTFSYRPVLSGLALGGSDFGGTPLDLTGSLDDQAGFPVHVPDLLPVGFELRKAETFTVPQELIQTGDSFLPAGGWVRIHATDGIESLSFAHSESVITTPGITEDQIRVLKQGSWEYGFGTASGVAFITAGRVSAMALRQLVESAIR